MPRKARIDAPGALHHIIARGIDRRSIFEDDTDCKDFLNRVATILSDERILVDGDFVTTVLQQAGEQFERRYDLKAKGYDFEAVVQRVVILLGMESNQVLTSSKNKQSVRARSLVCFWAFSELGLNQTELAQKFGISQPAVSSAVRKGEKTVRTDGYELLEDIKL